MLKFGIIFIWLSWLLGNPIFALILLLLIVYVLDRRFVGLTPSVIKPLKRRARIGKLKRMSALSPSDVSMKQELARLLIQSKRFKEALAILEPLGRTLEDSAEYWDDLGHCYAQTGQRDKGEAAMRKALEINPRVKYGAPYLRLADMHVESDSGKALDCLRQFQDIQSSSCEAYYRLSVIYKSLGQPQEAKLAIEEGLRLYRMLPRYKKRTERQWAAKLQLKKLF